MSTFVKVSTRRMLQRLLRSLEGDIMEGVYCSGSVWSWNVEYQKSGLATCSCVGLMRHGFSGGAGGA